jgi:hypothetical protein
MRGFYRLFRMLLMLMVCCDQTVCFSKSLEEPIVEKSGDFIIAGIFNVGELREEANP